MGNMFGDCHAPCALKTSFVDFERVGALYCYKSLNFSSLLPIRWQSKVIDPIGPSLHSFLYSFYMPVFKTGRIMVYHCPSVCLFHMSRSNLRTPWPIHFKFHIVIGIDSLMVCILFGEISIFIPELWDFIHQIVGDFLYVAL
jgi:hypothetical protein